MNNEIEEIENWQWRWCNIQTGMPILGSPTGTPPDWAVHPYAQYVLRHIQLGKIRVHSVCGGEIVKKFDSKWIDCGVSVHKFWDECDKCGKRFNETDYE